MALSKKQMSVDDYSVALTSVVHNPLFSGDDDIDPQPMGFGNPTYATLREDEEPGFPYESAYGSVQQSLAMRQSEIVSDTRFPSSHHENQKSEKPRNNPCLVIGIVIAIAIAVVALALAALIVTGTISIKSSNTAEAQTNPLTGSPANVQHLADQLSELIGNVSKVQEEQAVLITVVNVIQEQQPKPTEHGTTMPTNTPNTAPPSRASSSPTRQVDTRHPNDSVSTTSPITDKQSDTMSPGHGTTQHSLSTTSSPTTSSPTTISPSTSSPTTLPPPPAWNQTVIDLLNDNIIRLGGDMVKVMQALAVQTSAIYSLQDQLSRLEKNVSVQWKQIENINKIQLNQTVTLSDVKQTQGVIVSEVADARLRVNDLELSDVNIEKSISEVDTRLSAGLVNRTIVDQQQSSHLKMVSQDIDVLEDDLDKQDTNLMGLKKNLTNVRIRVVTAEDTLDLIPVDCHVSAWSTWSLCSKTCGGGSQVRTRRVTALPSNGGVDCPPLTETRVCNEDHCIGCSGGCTTYIHWGNTTCRRGTRLLYAGVAASSSSSDSGSGHNRLCMPLTPDFVTIHNDNLQYGGFLYGAEYETSNYGVSDFSSVSNQPIACAVCEVAGAATLMIPATTNCPAGWMTEYQGYLMANYYSHRKGEYVCVDKNPESASIGNSNTNQARWYPTETYCGSLPCPPYTQDRELSCVVCSPSLNVSGTVYTRWGRTSCPNDTELVYSGRAASTHTSESGSGANNLCLYGNPTYLQHNDNQQQGARIYGIQYYTNGYGLRSFYSLHQHRAPCSVCLKSTAETNLMIPGRNDCPTDWTVEYKGYLMANYYNHHKINWVCVDENPESLGYSPSGQGRWYPTETECGRMKCQNGIKGAYYQDWELSCALCSPSTSRRSSVFTHWGSNSCPNGTRTVYSGFMGGSYYSYSGSGANLLCMQAQAVYGEHETQSQSGALLYGYEYRTRGYGLRNSEFQNVHNRQIPCAVCETVRPSTTFTLFGMRDCPIGFNATYRGYMFSDYYSHQKSQFVCIDEKPEIYGQSSTSSYSQGLLYPVETRCGALPCPPYTQYRESTCSQCTTAVSVCTDFTYNGTCVRECPFLTYVDKQECFDCHDQCLDGCTGPLAKDCFRCANVLLNATKECVALCPNKTVKTVENVCIAKSDLLDCEGVKGGNKSLDACGVCGGDGTTCNQNAVYVHWGSEYCPNGTRRLFWGFAASEHHSHYGSGYNRLCLPSYPDTGDQHSDSNQNGGFVYGSTYETGNSGVAAMRGVDNGAIACAVCEARRGAVTMIPGTNQCPSGWQAEYSGYIMSNYYSHYRGEFVCVDQTPERSTIAKSNHHQLDWYMTEYYCGNLPCPLTYVQYREITCVVCSPESKTGGVYVQWGRTTCTSNDTYGDVETLYSGQSAGAHHSESGSGANPLCLVKGKEIRYGEYNDQSNSGGRLYGAQYETSGYGIASSAIQSVHRHLIPCSVCFTTDRDSHVVISGQNACPGDKNGDWRMEYSGFLFAAYYGSYSANWVCIDREPESLGFPRSNQARWYPTEVECGSIRCQRQTGGYIQDRELTCAVCSPRTKRQGAVYTRWGRRACPNDASLVYSGFAAGSHYSHSGSGANVLCMTQTATYAEHNDQNQDGARLYGYEYKTSGYGLQGQYRSVHNHEVPCAVCENRKASATMTMFGKTKCPEGYRADYSGYTFAHYYTSSHWKGEYICVDTAPETYVYGSSSSYGHAQLYPVEIECGATPCPPYEHDRELPCVQCSLEQPTCKKYRYGTDCVDECPILTYSSADNECRSCHRFCAEGCSGPESNACVGKCVRARFNGTCLSSDECPKGTVLNSQKTCVRFQAGMDCAGTVGGTKVLDACGVCDGDNSTCRQSAVYVRWGRKDCPSGARFLFEGLTAGSHNDQSGSGYNRLCFPLSPGFGAGVHRDSSSDGALVYGVEYETSSWSSSPWDSVRNWNVPCAVCEAQLGSTFMLPGNNTCPTGFKAEYEGYVMANYYSQQAGEYLCVDKSPVKGTGTTNKNWGRLYPTEYQCGNLPCSKYPNGNEVSCVVCSPDGPSSGSTYVRWGRSDCPSSAQLVYAGRAANADSNYYGSGANSLCLTDSPNFPYVKSGVQTGARLRGLRYVTGSYGIQSLKQRDNYAVPCAVCFTPNRESNIMQPGRDDCPVGWELQYSGYLFGSYYSHRKTNFMCVDKGAQSLERATRNCYIYPAEIECGSIRCNNGPGGYRHDYEITCAVCTPDTKRKGVTYTRWGRRGCSAKDRLVYSGFAASSYHTHSGSGANALCMAKLANYGEYNSGNQYGAQLYGYEYNPWGLYGNYQAVNQREVPCAVCENNRAVSTFTLWANTTCPTGFTTDYTGYIFSTYYYRWYKNEFVCVDVDPEYYENGLGTGSQNQAELVPAEFEACTQFSCPPWVQDRELACAQCSNTKLSDDAQPVDCEVGNWSEYTNCTVACGGGTRNRSRTITVRPLNGGRACPPLEEQQVCNTFACPDVIHSNSTYIHWGRYTCNRPSKVLFTGYSAGKSSGHSGSGFNYMCLPNLPDTGTIHNDQNQEGSLLYGLNYENYGYIGNLSSISRYAIPCAMCEAERGDVMTLYGTTSCPSGWREEYQGYIMSTRYNHQKAQFICVDDQATWRPDRRRGSNQGYLYLTESECGSLKCPSYVQDRELTCVVCSPLTRSGSVYTRWGRKSCPSGSNLIHFGQSVSSHYSHSGGGANTLCLYDGDKADYLNYNDGDNGGAYLYGVTYHTSGYGLNTFKIVHAHRVPCAVCFAAHVYSTLMIPAAISCPTGWFEQYTGYLFSAYYTHKKEDWLCVDEAPESNGNYGSLQAGIYPTEIECGSIKCGSAINEYLSNHELTCTLCAPAVGKESSLFTRWGRTICPIGSKEVYNGFAAGSHHSYSGSGTSALCMPKTASYIDYSGLNQNGGLLYGYEYETSSNALTSSAYKRVYQMEVPCVVCDAQRTASTFTHFGSQTCPRGYNADYVGYAFGHYYSHSSTGEHICVDDQPEGYNNGRGTSNDNQGMLYPVEVECGTLPCPPFTQNRELQCAQCSFVGINDTRPINCEVGYWSSWSACSHTCGNEGNQMRNRSILVEAKYGGRECSPELEQVRQCNVVPCPAPPFKPGQSGTSNDCPTSYVRWGRTQCPGNSTKLYSGYAASSNDGHSGSGFNRLCIPERPEFGLVHYDKSASTGYLYGQEYETNSYGLRNFSQLANYPVPCVVCEVNQGPVLQVPGTLVCPSGWVTEYQGYLMANWYSHYRGEYVCVDKEAERVPVYRNNNNGRWYPTETECGVLNCGDSFTQDRELPCAVCTPSGTDSGSVYTRWGRTTCPVGTQIVYSGQAAGPRHSNSGSGANSLCLTLNPVYGDSNDQNQNGAFLGGARYYTSGYGIPRFYSVHNHRVPCAVCFAPKKMSNYMQPGNTTCPSGFHREYAGLLFAAYHSHNKHDWMCVDENPESLGYSSSSFGQWYPTEVRCGSIQCQDQEGGYQQYREVSCSVCSPDTTRTSSIYTRWGRSDCPVNNRKVYNGFAAGAYHSHSGSGASVLCMPPRATYGDQSDRSQSGSLLYGYEYETSEGGTIQATALRSVNNREVSCAVCENTQATSSFTLFGSTTCPSGYDMEYTGYAFSSRYSERKSSYVCVDKTPSYYSNGLGTLNNNQARLYPVEYRCGSLLCPPYVNYREILCSQCSKLERCLHYVYNGSYVAECPTGTFLNSTTDYCDDCHPYCGDAGCRGPLNSDCIGACKYFVFNGSCVASCPATFISNVDKKCVKATPDVDCEGNRGGNKVYDRCGVCGGDGQSCNQKAIYIHWGSSSCPQPSRKLFEGYTASPQYSQSGGGYNYVCLQKTPTSGFEQSDYSQSSGELFGVEYRTGTVAIPELQRVNGATVPCAACEAPRSGVFMYPASSECPGGWHEEYEGYVMANYYTSSYQRKEFICVERFAERGSGPSSRSQSFVYPTEVQCNGLPCPPYTQYRELACVVCSPEEAKGSGEVYIRWGKASCPSNSTTVKVYDGRTAVSHTGHSGGGSNPLCLPMEPTYLQHNDNDQSSAYVYGAYYHTSSGPPHAQGLRAVHNRRIPCSVCFTPDVHTHVMVPGRYTCPGYFKPEYYGYLFSAYYGSYSVNYICVDNEPEPIGSESGGGAPLYTVEIECGSLRCRNEDGGYVANREATCVVCTPDTRRKTAVYTRWGSNTCPGTNATTRQIYSGFVAGSYHGHSGSGNNFLCMHPTAQYLNHSDSDHSSGRLYGYEYENSGLRGPYRQVYNREVPCAICENLQAATTFTQFGSDVCPVDYSADYTGYVMSSTSGHWKTEFICVDRNPDFYDNGLGTTSNNHGMLYPVESRCGSLPCPPYTDEREVMCAQCSRLATRCSYFSHGQTCVTSCPLMTYSDKNKVCQECHPECADGCSGSTAFNCTSCQRKTMDVLGECVAECPTGFVSDVTNVCVKSTPLTDCAGVVNGTKVVDRCGVCGGDNLSCNLKAVYVRWGRTTCPSTAKLLYYGTAASSLDDHSGGGHNSLCLPNKPGQSWEHTDTTNSGSYLYGAEFETGGFGVSDLFGVANSPIQCAVCEAARGETVMVPGNYVCPKVNNTDWVVEYTGYLMVNQYNRYKGEFVCVDRHPERVTVRNNHNQVAWYPTEFQCGTLSCPPYNNDRELACVVCSPPSDSHTGTVYTRWGRQVCASGNAEIYKGRAASSPQSGSGANPICVYPSPAYLTHSDSNNGGAQLYGAQYKWNSQVVAFQSVDNKAIPCTVCLVAKKGSTIMVPGENFCPKEWKLEYWGYLMAAYYTHQKSNWVCVDSQPETISPPSSGSGQTLWYPTEIECGSIECSRTRPNGYVQNREVTCAVCSPVTSRRTTVYTRYGRNFCPSGSTLVRNGFLAGSYFSHTGSGANFLCMTPNTTYADHNDNNQEGALLYGYEYETSSGALRSSEYRSVHNYEVPCAVCENVGSSSTFTMFGNNTCPSGYSSDFVGYAFSTYHGSYHRKGEFVCVDDHPEKYTNNRGNTNNDQGRLYPVALQCGTLPCPPYSSNREVVCAQCSKIVGSCDGYWNGQECVSDCPPRKYADGEKRCQACHDRCGSGGCSGPAPTQCVDCLNVTYKGECIAACPNDTVSNPQNVCVFKNASVDCAGVVGGSQTTDRCGVCGGDGTSCNAKAVYTRWGRKSCPTGARKLYEGYSSSASDGSSGGGFDRLCLPRDPGFAYQHTDSDQDGAETYGAEYETGSGPSAQVRSVSNSPIPCAVCEAVRGSVLQVSGSTQCPTGWSREYYGYVMANYYTNNKGEYVCVDVNMEKGDGGSNRNQDRWYIAEIYCEGIKCPPYVQYRELACAVCIPPQNESGVVYYRWGRSDCPGDAKSLYAGHAVSSRYSNSGSGANAMCLVDSPSWTGLSTSDSHQNGARLSGARYQISGNLQDLGSRINGKSVPCSACYVSDKEAHIMAPGSDVCPSGWQLEYKGYLFAGYYTHKKNDWVCLDQNAQAGSAPNNGYAYWYPTEVRCGGIPCDTTEQDAYVDQREVTCAVCTPDTKRKSSVFVRWGRPDCPSSAVKVYDGLVGGAYHTHTGSGASVLCLRKNATYAERNDNSQNGALLYGVEFESSGLSGSDYKAMDDRQMSCAVCESRAISATFTLFGKDVCPEGYVSDYTGYGFANRHCCSYQKSNFICLDDKPQEYSRRKSTNYNQGRVWPMEAYCGTLPCPPYTQEREMLCTQCTRQSSVCPHFRDGQDCVLSCGKDQYADSSRRCRSCDSECLGGCTAAGPSECVKCAHYRDDGKCVSQCPNGKIADLTNDCIGTQANADCAGVLHGGKKFDRCGVCGGDGSSCRRRAIFTRWGHRSCPSGSTKIYDGYMGTASHGHRGSGYNALCLSLPGTSYASKDTNQNGDLVYGANFRTSRFGVSSLNNVDGYRVACAVCEANGTATYIAHGTTVCAAGWNVEYWGYVMAPHYTYYNGWYHYRSEYICVDNTPNTTLGTGSNQGILYPTELECGNVPCNVYKHDYELTCAVCSSPAANTTGSVYTRWGRKTCPSTAETLYNGYAARGHYAHTGSGANNLCLIDKPSYVAFDKNNQNGALIYGISYESSGVAPDFDAVYRRTAPCAVCFSSADANMVYPGRYDCPNDWKVEYKGYLMAEWYTSYKGNWACVDDKPESVMARTSAQARWYMTEIECGSIWCRNQEDRYIQNRELTCSVCTPKDDATTSGTSARYSATYVRWGREECPSTDDVLVYKGFAAGSHYGNWGSGANVFCMPEVPLYGKFDSGDNNGALLYGYEYETTGRFLGPDLRAVENKMVSCAVCMNRKTISTFTHFGDNICPTGYQSDYWGYVFAHSYSEVSKGEHMCVDNSPSAYYNPRSNGDFNQARLYPAEIETGSLPNPPYTQDREILCAQCSKKE